MTFYDPSFYLADPEKPGHYLVGFRSQRQGHIKCECWLAKSENGVLACKELMLIGKIPLERKRET